MNAIGFQPWSNPVSELPVTELPEGARQTSAFLSQVWLGLLSGRFRVLSAHVTSESATLRLFQSTRPHSHDRAAKVFDAAANGTLQKCVALDAGLAPSSIAAMLRQVTRSMGLQCTFKRLPLAVPLLRHVITRPELVTLRVEREEAHRYPVLIIEMKRCGQRLADRLSKGEYDVVCQLLEGRSYQQMARSRDTSVRTVANQISSVFRKLGVSGRFEVLRTTMAEGDQAARSFARPRPPAPAWRDGSHAPS
jgi:DNA-binding CsgD family transcriptional regulator